MLFLMPRKTKRNNRFGKSNILVRINNVILTLTERCYNENIKKLIEQKNELEESLRKGNNYFNQNLIENKLFSVITNLQKLNNQLRESQKEALDAIRPSVTETVVKSFFMKSPQETFNEIGKIIYHLVLIIQRMNNYLIDFVNKFKSFNKYQIRNDNYFLTSELIQHINNIIFLSSIKMEDVKIIIDIGNVIYSL